MKLQQEEEIIAETYSFWEASIIKNLLEGYGIMCRFLKEGPDLLPFTINGLARIRVVVKKEEAERAKLLLKDLQKKNNYKLIKE
jgi:hypothetical protein